MFTLDISTTTMHLNDAGLFSRGGAILSLGTSTQVTIDKTSFVENTTGPGGAIASVDLRSNILFEFVGGVCLCICSFDFTNL